MCNVIMCQAQTFIRLRRWTENKGIKTSSSMTRHLTRILYLRTPNEDFIFIYFIFKLHALPKGNSWYFPKGVDQKHIYVVHQLQRLKRLISNIKK